jgi:hypothetical protein
MPSSPISNSIFVDEAGDPGLSSQSKTNQPFFVMGFVYCEDPSTLKKRLKRFLKKQHLRGRYPPHLSELKFYLPYSDLIQEGYTVPQLDQYNAKMPLIRSRAISLIALHCTGVFAAVLDKRRAAITWTPERIGNFIFAQSLIVNVMNVVSPPNPPIIFYDQGRLSPAKSFLFKNYLVQKDSYFQYKGLKRYRGSLAPPIDVASVSEPGIWAADMVAGAFYHKYANNDWSYANILSLKVIGGHERVYWP